MSEEDDPVRGDDTRQAIDSLGGYANQICASTLAWLRLKAGETLYLEIAEDYAVAAKNSLQRVQVKRTDAAITLNTASVQETIDHFVLLTELNPDRFVTLRY